ncbi:MAG: glycosyltransferase family 2 protein [Anaerolineae bacterium]|nr:glycosyltransferase family 2 protein [Anaerolineae bacterium]
MKVSVLVGSRNRPDVLRRCVATALNQDYSDLQILVLDDHSDRYRLDEIIQAEFHDPRLRCFRSEQPLGVAGGRNFLMQQASGDIFCVIDDDACFAQTDAVSRLVETFDAHSRVGILAFKIINHVNNKTDLRLPFNRRQRRKNPRIMTQAGLVSYFVGTGHAIRRCVIERCGSYRADLMYGEEELDLSYQAIEQGFEILYVPEIAVLHYPQPSVVTRQKGYRHQELYYHVRNRFFLAYKYLPARYIPSYLSVWLITYGFSAAKSAALGEYCGGIAAGFKLLRQLKRTPLSRQAIAYLAAHHGRLWY